MDLENFPTRETAKDMLSMISPIYDRSYVGKWIFQVMAASMELARETVEDMKNQAFPEISATRAAIRYGFIGRFVLRFCTIGRRLSSRLLPSFPVIP